MHNAVSEREMNEKRVHFGSPDDFQEPDNSNDISLEEEQFLNSPLKATHGLGSTIKKLSPVSGAKQTEEAKRAYDRLLQQAAMSMFNDEDGDDVNAVIGKENTANSSRITPDFYKSAAEIATPNSHLHAMNRLESQQYDLSPPMPRGLAPPVASIEDASIPTTPIASSHRDILAYREARSATTSGSSGFIHKQLLGSRQDFSRAHLGSASPPAAEAERGTAVETEGEIDTFEMENRYNGVATESSPAAAAILNAHLNSIRFEEGPAKNFAYKPQHNVFVKNNLNQDEKLHEMLQFYESASEMTEYNLLAEKPYAISEHADRDANSDSQQMHNSEEASVAPALINPISNAHVIAKMETHKQMIEPLCVDQQVVVSILEGEQLLNRHSLFLRKLEEELPRFCSIRKSESNSVPMTTTRAIELQTYSMDELEASVLLKHEQLMTSGLVDLRG